MLNDDIVIVSYTRTPLGNLLGELKEFTATQLGAHVIRQTILRAKVHPEDVNEVIMGCVLPAGLGQAPARQAALNAGIPFATPCSTINKVCGSAMKAIMLAHDMIIAKTADIVIAGGMESMTNAPYLLLKARQGYRLGHNQLFDHMMLDGLEDAYDKGKSMGYFAEQCVRKYSFTRKQQDDFALNSFIKAQHAIKEGKFSLEISPLVLNTKQGEKSIENDERPFSVNPEKIPQLSPAFDKEGTVTAGNSSSISDGAATIMLMRFSEAVKRNVKPIARILSHSSFSQNPQEFTTSPIYATKALLNKLDWTVDDVDLFEVNEAFAVVVLAYIKDLNIPTEKINIHGGACALGHPIGASGARIVVTLLAALQQNNLKRGMASLCIGGGESTAIALEIIE